MPRPPRSQARRRVLAALTATATAATGCALLAPGTSSASSHREAPFIAGDPAVDNTDTYAFVAPDKTGSVTMIANWSGFQDPSGGPNFYPWATDAAYDINIDNNGDAKVDILYRWTFDDVDTRGTTNNGDNTPGEDDDGNAIAPSGIDGTFLYNNDAVTSLDDENLLFKQTYDLQEIKYNTSGAVTSTTTLLNDSAVAPSHVGSASIPDYAALRVAAVAEGVIPDAGGNSYVGQADDPFFLDLRVFDLLYGADLSKRGFDTLSHYNVNTIALQVPKTDVTAGGDAAANPVIGVWSTTSRETTRTLAATGSAPTVAQSTGTNPALAQVSRLGMPLVNEVVVPAQLKDYFNRSEPSQDGALLGKVQNPELPVLLEAIYGIPNVNQNPDGNGRPDLVAAFLTGISKAVFRGEKYGGLGEGSVDADLNSLSLNAIASTVTQNPAEYLRLNTAVPPSSSPKRLGVLEGDFAGFPNGRRLADDVLDIELQVAAGVLVDETGAGLGDNVNRNDKSFLGVFPYIADPFSGSSVNQGSQPVNFTQRFPSSGGVVNFNVLNVSPAQPGGSVELFRVRGGRYFPVGKFPLNAAGTASAASTAIRLGSGTEVTFYARILTGPDNASSTGFGRLTTINVR